LGFGVGGERDCLCRSRNIQLLAPVVEIQRLPTTGDAPFSFGFPLNYRMSYLAFDAKNFLNTLFQGVFP
jgi:hypothetical protein